MTLKGYLKELGLVVLIVFTVLITFILYLYFIGIPKTQARNHFNLGQIAENEGDVSTAKEEYQKALDYWNERYIKEALEKVRD
jgi:cell division protein FtsN